jgi:homoserine dehydrogenase
MDGTPIFNLVSECLPASEVLSFRGVLNSTTNFILTEMEKGVGFAAALSKAQRLGIAEADPSLDIDGWDSAAKVSAMLNVFMDADMNPQQVERTGIRGLTESKISQLPQMGRRVKLVCEGERNMGHPSGRVLPLELPLTDPLANVPGTSSILEIETDTMGRLTILENEPRLRQTAYALLSDLISIRRHIGRERGLDSMNPKI